MEQIDYSRLRLMVFQSALELGKKVEKHLQEMYGTEESFILPIKENFFFRWTFKGRDNGHCKRKRCILFNRCWKLFNNI